jgi:hypothetical protein
MADLTAERARELLDYDPGTGVLTWKASGKAASAVPGSRGYLTIRLRGKLRKQHRVAWLLTHGEWPGDIDHINGVKADNRLCNLREVTKSQNARNVGISWANTSGFKGVSWDKRSRRWQALIRAEGRLKKLGTFATREEAALAYRTASVELHGVYGRPA